MNKKLLVNIFAVLALAAMGFSQVTSKPAPVRDPKTGRFVKTGKAPTPPKGKGAVDVPAPPVPQKSKGMPARDPKTGRFIKKTDSAPIAKTMPARDPKTGRFIKKTDTAPVAKTAPARDPKTGRFIKKAPVKGKTGAG